MLIIIFHNNSITVLEGVVSMALYRHRYKKNEQQE